MTTGQGAGVTACDVYLATPVLRDAGSFLPDLARGLQCQPAAVLLRLADAPDAELTRQIQTFQSVVQAQDIALILEDRPLLAAGTGCDGVHLSTRFAGASIKDVRRQVGDDLQLGVAVGGSRDAAMRAGEAGADYISFSTATPVVAAEGEAPESLAALVRWWCLVMELPAVVEVEDPAQVADFIQAGADFVLPGPSFWEQPSLWTFSG
ncbi:thiamine phosphate synthase [Acetobacter farinalis]|uniref:Thiamine phosphate synthase n=1 Tax=Acetobacter farinalis TaxID=1260984 RepID=A0ABT3Q7T3_9PROT|nr:thiamine phosphate synthase [Acetobacter farinalis]MCX2561326.1 thiamine phosphate synthase [Acetobacter farinalis]NHO29904.1 thiamine phosphate synthase [Acetobacter farinalis]